MRKLTTAIAATGLMALGLAVPASAQAAEQGMYCDAEWSSHGRDGNVRAWNGFDCTGTLLGVTPGNDPDWSDNSGPFQGNDWNQPKSVANNGTIGGNDVVAFYLALNYAYQHGYVCLSPYELYADDVTDNRYTSGSVPTTIASHRWVQSSGCAANSWLT